MPVPLRANANLRAEAKYNVVTECMSSFSLPVPFAHFLTVTNYGLHSAAASGNQGLVEFALSRGQPINSVLDGVLPLHAASAGGDEQVVKLLIDRGADVNAPRLPRRYSNEKNRDASVPIVGTNGSTPLHFAAANGNKNVITTLLQRGAHPDRRDKHGITPAMLAEQHGWMECAEVLNNWVDVKDKDLREREGAVNYQDDPAADNEEDGCSGSARKRIQMKRSLDTALNMFKASSSSLTTSQSRQYLSASTHNLNTASPPTSPSRSRGDLSPSPSEDGQFSPSPSPIDPGSRRPSLPHVLQAPHSSPSSRKPATLTKAPRAPRRPRSAGTDAERPDADMSTSASTGRGSAGRRLGTKYSLLNLFKKGQTVDSYGVPLERTASQQTTNSSMGFYNSRLSQNNSFVNDSGPLPKAGFRFGGSTGTLSSSPSQISHSLSHTRGSPSTSSINQPYSPPPPTIPLAVDLHNAMAHQYQPQQQNRGRSGSSESAMTRPTRSVPIPIPSTASASDDGHQSANNSAPLSTSPLARKIAKMTQTGHCRDRSGSASSLNRNVAVFDDDLVVAVSDQSLPGSRASSRPGILRGHNRTSSSGQGGTLRALRFDSASSTSSGNRRDKDGDLSPPLRGSTSAGSLNKFRQRERRGSSRSPSRMRPPFEGSIDEVSDTRLPGHSAPATITDFDIHSRNPIEDEEEDEDAYLYGRPIQSSLAASHLPHSQFRNRGASFASSASSLSPSLAAADVGTTSTAVANGDFPFSISRPPPIALDETETSGTGSRLQVPSATHTDNRARGDSVSSTSTTDSTQNPDLSASGTSNSGGSEIKTPIRSPEALPAMAVAAGTDVNGLRAPDGIAIASLHERRSQSPLRPIKMDLVQSHAQAEALVQQKKQDILSAHSVQATTTAGYTPLSARLAALGESLEIERKLREKKSGENTPGGVDLAEISEVDLDRKKKPITSAPNIESTQKISLIRPTHHPSLSASAVESSPTLEPTYDFALPNSRSFTEASYMRPLRARTPDPALNLSRVSSLEGFHDGPDTDTELGPALFRVSTAPHTASKGQRDRNMASNAKLTRMGLLPNANDPSNGRAPPKLFGGLKSLVQTLKGRQLYYLKSRLSIPFPPFSTPYHFARY
ncbi:hypothetical protein D9758_008476 [Tetrapyrgos nigripes]|uniref:Ankyrin n=1 Tax=Tetrapyrgos nigripes TaxID=182062 RepID=A0A8H5FQD5_9AGAR|nr:hypothetical protein D9758_008476 [Tetrapyrgos nigripes]